MMDCFCDYEPPEFYNKYSLRARKVHRCEECGGEIRAGEKYEYVSGKWCGDFSTFKTCERCADLRQWVKNSVPCFCWAHGSLHDDARDTVQDASGRAGEEAAGLRFGLLRRLVAIEKFNRNRPTLTGDQR
jgi:hypothetical protein